MGPARRGSSSTKLCRTPSAPSSSASHIPGGMEHGCSIASGVQESLGVARECSDPTAAAWGWSGAGKGCVCPCTAPLCAHTAPGAVPLCREIKPSG